jgi:holo-[acyl-carrier protein] synthase
MTAAIGIDIEEISRFRSIKNLDRFLELIYTKYEIEQAKKHPSFFDFLATRFVVKEAVIKALPEPIPFRDIEIYKGAFSKPLVRVNHEKYKKLLVHISLAHCPNYAVGVAYIEV